MGDQPVLRYLALTCAELNYRNSLVHDAVELRAAVVAALTRSADVLDGLATHLRQRAEHCAPGAQRDRLLAAATRARVRATTGRHRSDHFATRPLERPRAAEAA
ncbi:MAG TPA: hypothetical protein VGH76_01110 [Actinomycetospora sp.]|jgi:hypothetical protein|uniref:hypothetical protein n=1 Tax=Actinomycetospora sp. TaxID=1872135 RepID=UPI002F42CB64